MIYNENIRCLSAHYCYMTDKNTVLHITNPECEEDGNGYIVAEHRRDRYGDIECVSALYEVNSWSDIEKEYNITKFLGIGYSYVDAVFLLDEELSSSLEIA